MNLEDVRKLLAETPDVSVKDHPAFSNLSALRRMPQDNLIAGGFPPRILAFRKA